MSNPYHDAEGKFCSKGEMLSAIKQAGESGDLETYFRLRTDYNEIEKNQDPTNPKNVLKEEKKIKAKQTEQEEPEVDHKGLVEVTFPETHTYEVPYNAYKGETRGYSRIHVGHKFDSNMTDASKIAKAVREDLKTATKAGYLPKGLNYSVKIGRFSGGQSININIQNTRDSQMRDEKDNRRNKTHKELEERVNGILNAYNSSENDSMTDYFSNLYYGHASIESESYRAYRLDEEAHYREKRRVQPIRNELFTAWKEKDEAKLNSMLTRVREEDGYELSKVQGTNLYSVKRIGGTYRVAFDATDMPEETLISRTIKGRMKSNNFFKTRKTRRR